jgi:hypothetical protein
MAKCSLGVKSAFVLGECIAVNETLKTINISGNDITDVGFRSYVDLFKSNNTIENFDCSCNFITDYSGKDFIKSLFYNQSLKNLNLYDNQLHDETGNLIIEILEVNKCLVHINLNFNRIQVRIIEEINKTLNQNYDKQKINFIPGLLRNIKDLEFQPELFTILSKKILEKKSLQNFLYKKVRKDEKTFNLLINIEKRKIEKEKVKLNELLIEKKNIEMEIINILKKIEYYERERRKKEEEIKEKIEIEKNSLNEIYGENRKVMAEYNFVKDDLTNDFEKVQRNSIISREKFNSAKRYYEKKDREYIY